MSPQIGPAIEAVKAAHQAVPIQAVGLFGTSITLSQILLIALNLMFGTFGVALVKAYPKIKEIAATRAGSLDDQRRKDMDRMTERLEKVEKKADDADRRAQIAENKLVSAVSAISLLSAEVRRLQPDSPVLDTVAELLQSATSGDFGIGRGIERLSQTTKR